MPVCSCGEDHSVKWTVADTFRVTVFVLFIVLASVGNILFWSGVWG